MKKHEKLVEAKVGPITVQAFSVPCDVIVYRIPSNWSPCHSYTSRLINLFIFIPYWCVLFSVITRGSESHVLRAHVLEK